MLRAFAATTARPLAKAAHARGMAIAVGSKFPSVDVDAASWPPTAFNLADRIANKKVRETRTFIRARPCLSPLAHDVRVLLCDTGDRVRPARRLHAHLIQGPGAWLQGSAQPVA